MSNAKLTEKDKLKLVDRHNAHLLNKKVARNLMKADKELAQINSSVCTICFDLQKLLSTSQADEEPMCYMSKLCVYNLTMIYMSNSIGYCYV